MKHLNLERGMTVRIAAGTSVLVWDGESYHADGVLAGYQQYERMIWDDPNGLTVQTVGVSHSTMNGGGRDYWLRDEETGNTVKIRTTFQRPERAIFTVEVLA